MNRLNSVVRPLMWLMASITVVVLAGCGSSSDSASQSSAKIINAYSIAGNSGTIDESAKTIAVTVPNARSVTALVATYTSNGAAVMVGTTVQASGTTPNDFTGPVAYVVIAADGSTVTYTVTVTIAPPDAKALGAFSFSGGSAGTITGTASPYAIAVTVPFGTNVTALIATYSTTGANVKVGTAVQTSGTTTNNFTSPVAYIVTAADASTATYKVTVTVAPSSAKALSAFSFALYSGATGSPTGSASPYAIAVTVPFGTNLTALIATYSTTGASVKVGLAVQTSGTTTNNFTSPVAYIVTAADASTATYNVTVTVAAASTTVIPGIVGTTGANTANPTVNSAIPSNADINVPTSTRGDLHTNLVGFKMVVATFDEAMDPATINSVTPGALSTFTLKETIAGTIVSGTVAMNAASTVATFNPSAVLVAGTSYTATITTAAKNAGSLSAIPKAVQWSFTTRATSAANQANPFVGQAPIDLLTAGNFVILAQTAITDVPASVITGDIGLSSATGANIFVSCAEMFGASKIYAVDAAYSVTGFAACSMPGAGANKTLVDNAVADKGTAYTEAAGRANPDAINLGAAEIGGKTFYPGLYQYTGASTITTDVTLDAQGDTNAVWIFQISGDLTVASGGGSVPAGIKVILAGGAKASNIFWQVAASSNGVTINAYDTFNGNIMSSAQVIANTGAVVNGRMLAATQVVLQQNPVTQPAP